MSSKRQSIKTVEKQIKAKENELHKLRDIKFAIACKTLFFCTKCKKKSRISSWVFIQRLYYVEPHGCAEGGYWSRSDPDVCDIRCPKCGHENYIYNHPQKNVVVGLIEDFDFDCSKKIFKKVIEI